MLISGVVFKIKNEDRKFIPQGVWEKVDNGYLIYLEQSVRVTKEPSFYNDYVAFIDNNHLEYIFYTDTKVEEEKINDLL